MTNKPSQQPAEGERLKIQNPKDYAIKLAQKEVPSYGAPTTISPTEEELEREAEGWAKRNFIDVTLQPIAKYCYLAAAKRYTRQGGEDERIGPDNHNNLFALTQAIEVARDYEDKYNEALDRIAELEKERDSWRTNFLNT